MDAPSINTFKSRLCYIRDTRWAFSWTSPLSPRPCWLHRLQVRLHKVNHKVKSPSSVFSVTLAGVGWSRKFHEVATFTAPYRDMARLCLLHFRLRQLHIRQSSLYVLYCFCLSAMPRKDAAPFSYYIPHKKTLF